MSDDTSDDSGVVLSAEIMDRAERKALKEKARKEEEAKKKEKTPDEIEAALAQGKLAAAQKEKRKKTFKLGLGLVGIGLIFWLYNWLFSPYKAGITYGICKIFLELNVQFPRDLRISTVEDMGESVRIWYTQIDAFGEYRMENIQCYYRADEVTGAAIDKITINRREIDPARVEAFNKVLPVILQSPPDLTIPYPLPNSLEGLQFETDKFRKPIF